MKNKIGAFSTARVQPHQVRALLDVSENGGRAAVILGFWEARKQYWFLIFDINFIVSMNGESLYKKEIMNFHNSGLSVSLQKTEQFSSSFLIDRIITSRRML